VQEKPAFVEAFGWADKIEGVQTSILGQTTSPAARAAETTWRVAQANDHWPSLFFGRADLPQGVPLLSNNNALILAMHLDRAIVPGTGVVFGKLMHGWNVALSGRSEGVLILDSNNQKVDPENVQGERYFAFINVEPGAHVLSLNKGFNAGSGGTVTLVLGGTATYLDLSNIQEKRLSGHVLDAAAQTPKGLGRVKVVAVGHSQVVDTDRDGAFVLQRVVVAGDYPVVMETEAPGSYKYRYQIRVSQGDANVSGLQLFRLRSPDVQAWISELEGGLSPESGLVVGALPRFLSEVVPATDRAEMFPGAQPLLERPTLQPESYTLSEQGHLLVNTPMSVVRSRYVGVQLPEGPVMTFVEDKAQNRVWSEVIFAQPGVINLVGPY